MSSSKDLAHGGSTWSVASYEDIVSRFQQDVQEAEDKDGYEDALAICLESMRRLESTDINKLTDEQKLELRFYHGQALNRSQFLFDSMMLSNRRFTEKLSLSTPTVSTSPAINQLCFGDMTSTKPFSVQSIDAFTRVESNVLDCTTADEDTEEELDTSKLERISLAKPIKNQNTKRPRVSKEDQELRQAVLDNVVKETPKIQFSDVIGLEKAKFALQDAVVVPLAFPDSPQAKNAWTGILLYGPSGVGKTRLIQALAGESKMNFLCVDTSSILSKWQGESTKNVKALFEVAREMSPCIMFLDECDALCGGRENCEGGSEKNVKTQFLVEIDGFAGNNDKRVVVIGNTNLPGSLDGGFLRRFGKRVYVDLPTEPERRQLLEYNLQDFKHNLTDKEVSSIAGKTEKFSGHDIKLLVTAASMEPCREVLQKHGGLKFMMNKSNEISQDLRNLTKKDFAKALKEITASNEEKSLKELKVYQEKWENSKSAVYEENEEMNRRLKSQSTLFKTFSFISNFFD